MTEIYLDHHTATYLDSEVLNVMQPYFKAKWGNYLQPHQKGQELIKEMHQMYQSVYELIDADPKEDDLIFVSSCEEAISHVFQIAYQNGMQKLGKNHFLTLTTEDAAILMNLKNLESMGCKLEYLPLKSSGVLDVDKIIETINPRTALISLSLAHGLTGIIQPLEKLKEVCKLRDIYLHLDISYAIGKIEINIQELGADFVTFGGDKFHGPKASGILYVRPGIKVKPLIFGGLEQRGLRGGAIDVASLAGLAQAAILAQQKMSEMCLEIASLRDAFESILIQKLDQVQILFDGVMRLPNVSVIAFKKVVADALLYILNQKKIYASLGGVQFQRMSYILETLGYPSEICCGALSFAFARTSTIDEVKQAADIIVQTIEEMAKMTEHIEEKDGIKATN